MIKHALPAFAVALIAANAFCQNEKLQIHDGMTISIDVLTYPNPLIADLKFLKASPGKRAEAVGARNADILARDMGSFYEIWDVNVRKTVTVSSHTLNNVKAIVSRTEPITVNGKPYTAYVIESQSWSKGASNTTLDVAHDYANKKGLAADLVIKEKAMLEKQTKNAVKMGMLNEDGYQVLTKEEWFVPEYGVVKLRNYDTYGSITTDVVIKPGA
ncbi:MAG: hypothetical protein JF616_15240 [Fibrobacteres bacterium]|jgi:hypothetical protein|nr:hypothetical protein [Fibrobacterota bacterium]